MTTVAVEGMSELLRKLKQFAPEVRKEFNKQAKAVVSGIVAQAKSNASWSRRIPGAIGPMVTTRAVGVRVSKRKAAHGPLYERGNKGRSTATFFRHPLFGNRGLWYSEPTRPFLQPAVDANRDEATRAMLQAIDDAKGKAGLS